MTAERLRHCFSTRAGKTRLVVYLTIGDPSVEDSLACARAALDAGADVLELGVPFSDPTADGPVIAAASHRAIEHGGSLRRALDVARGLRQQSAAPLVLFSYLNPIVAFGEEELPAAAAAAGVDGLLVVDMPPEEGALLPGAARAAELAMIPLVAPTTSPERLPLVVDGADGFVYYVSLTGVTGSAKAPLSEAAKVAAKLERDIGVPVAVGFGIDSPERARAVADAGVSGVVVGTAVVRAIAGAKDTAGRVAAVRELVAALRSGLDS